MNLNELYLYALAQMYHAASVFFAATQPWIAQHYEQMSRNVMAWLRAVGVVV